MHEMSCTISGLVQGVGYRWFVQRKASALHLTGWVQNKTDGSVAVTAQGPRKDLESLLRDLRIGPRSAMVHDVRVEWANPTAEFQTFEIR